MMKTGRAQRNLAEAELSKLGLHTGQEALLFQLWFEEGITQTQLVERLCVEPPTITKALQRLERSGLIERKPDPDDARVSRVYLTPAGRDLEAPVRETLQGIERRMVQGLSEAEQLLLVRMLKQIGANLGAK